MIHQNIGSSPLGRFMALAAMASLWSPLTSASDKPLQCPPAYQKTVMRLQVTEDSLERRVQQILEEGVPHIEEALNGLVLKDSRIAPEIESLDCPEFAENPGFDAESKCLYMPTFPLGMSTPLRNMTQSVATRMGFKDMKINYLDLGKINTTCRLSDMEQRCYVDALVNSFELESGFELNFVKGGHQALSTLTPQKIGISDKNLPEAHLRFEVNFYYGKPLNESVVIDPKTVKLDLPEDRVFSQIRNEESDVAKAYEQALLRKVIDVMGPSRMDFPINGTLDDKIEFIKEHKDDYSGFDYDSLIDGVKDDVYGQVMTSYLLIGLLKGFAGENDLFKLLFDSFWQEVGAPLGKLIGKHMQRNLPLSKTVEVTLPLGRGNDAINEERHVHLVHAAYLDLLNIAFDEQVAKEPDQLLEVTDSLVAFAKKHRKKERALIESHSERVAVNLEVLVDELKSIKKKVEQRGQDWGLLNYGEDPGPANLRRAGVSLRQARKFTKRTTNFSVFVKSIENMQAKIESHLTSEEKIIRFRLLGIEPAKNKNRINLLMSGCSAVNNDIEEVGSFDSEVPASKDSDTDFSAQISVSVINDYLRALHGKKYFDICITKTKTGPNVKDCRELRFFGSRQKFVVKKAPQIKFDIETSGYFLDVSDIHREGVVLLNIPFINRCMSDVTNMRIDFNKTSTGPGGLLNAESVDLDADMEANASRKWFCGALMAPLGIAAIGATLGIIVGHTLIQQSVLKKNRRSFSAVVNDGLNAITLFDIREISIRDGIITVHGKFKDDQKALSPSASL